MHSTLPALSQERTETEKAKARLDQAQLALQSILYEKSYYLNETRAILNFPCAAQHHMGLPLALGVQLVSNFTPCIYHLSVGVAKGRHGCSATRGGALLQAFASPLLGTLRPRGCMCRSKYTEEQIGLMPLEEFQASTAAQFREGDPSEHATTCRRLKHEKHARAEAVQQLEQLKSRRDALAATAQARWSHLARAQVLVWLCACILSSSSSHGAESNI